MESAHWTAAAVVLALAALGVVVAAVAVAVNVAEGDHAPVVIPSLPITVLLSVGLGLGARLAWRRATGRGAPSVGVEHQAWPSRGLTSDAP
ncbi:hypothetical protein OG937_33715 [Streptomyces sp. NBC_00510]